MTIADTACGRIWAVTEERKGERVIDAGGEKRLSKGVMLQVISR